MRKATVRDLRNHFSKLETWLGEGEHIQIEKKGIPIAVLTPISGRSPLSSKKPNFALRRQKIWGKRVLSPLEVIKLRAAEMEGEEG